MNATASPAPTGRFAPSPTGPLHLGSLLAAVGSWLFARSRGGRWLVRIEDLDSARVVPGSADALLESLARFGLSWDGEPVRQSARTNLYEEALRQLRSSGRAFECSCTRADLQRAASAPAPGEDGLVYPGTCRNGMSGRSRSVRFLASDETIAFDDALAGHVEQNVATVVGDFVIRRADGPFAYQLAVVADDAEQGVTEVVRGGDLLSSTARQIALQRALGLPTPRYAHLPLLVDAAGAKLGKRAGALPLPSTGEKEIVRALAVVLAALGIGEVEGSSPERMLRDALARFDVARIGSGPIVMPRGEMSSRA